MEKFPGRWATSGSSLQLFPTSARLGIQANRPAHSSTAFMLARELWEWNRGCGKPGQPGRFPTYNRDNGGFSQCIGDPVTGTTPTPKVQTDPNASFKAGRRAKGGPGPGRPSCGYERRRASPWLACRQLRTKRWASALSGGGKLIGILWMLLHALLTHTPRPPAISIAAERCPEMAVAWKAWEARPSAAHRTTRSEQKRYQAHVTLNSTSIHAIRDCPSDGMGRYFGPCREPLVPRRGRRGRQFFPRNLGHLLKRSTDSVVGVGKGLRADRLVTRLRFHWLERVRHSGSNAQPIGPAQFRAGAFWLRVLGLSHRRVEEGTLFCSCQPRRRKPGSHCCTFDTIILARRMRKIRRELLGFGPPPALPLISPMRSKVKNQG